MHEAECLLSGTEFSGVPSPNQISAFGSFHLPQIRVTDHDRHSRLVGVVGAGVWARS